MREKRRRSTKKMKTMKTKENPRRARNNAVFEKLFKFVGNNLKNIVDRANIW